jgi:NitT/TauT family transport system substrate-binding protein
MLESLPGGTGIVTEIALKKRTVHIVIVVLIVAMAVLTGCNGQQQTKKFDETQKKFDEIKIVGTIGPLSIPLAYMVDNNVLGEVTEKMSFETWATPQQLQAAIAGGQADFVSLPTNSAATFFNKGISLKLLDCSIWNILFLISSDENVSSVSDLVGKRVVVPYEGAVPDAVFRYVLESSGINPDTDIDIYYTPDPVQASQLIISGREQYALLSEPSATSVLNKAESSGITLYRNLDMNREWQSAFGGLSQSAIAGTIALGDMLEDDEVIELFLEEYRKAVEWMLENPEEAGELGAEVLAEQGFTAEALTGALENIDWRFVPAGEGYEEIENFFKALMEVSENYTGGKLPDAAFYYGRSSAG